MAAGISGAVRAEIENAAAVYNREGQVGAFCVDRVWDIDATGDRPLSDQRLEVLDCTEEGPEEYPCPTAGCTRRIEGDYFSPQQAQRAGSCCLTGAMQPQQADAA